MQKEILKEIGLSENESKVYLTLLGLGSSKVNEIYEKAKIPRTFVYEVLRVLIDKGLVSYVIKSGVRYYEASNPSKFKDILKEKEARLDKILPELESIRKVVKKKPRVELYEGKEGIKTILEDILKMEESETLYSYSNSKLFELLEFYFPNFVKRRVKRKIFAKIIEEETELMKKFRKKDKKEFREMRFSLIVFNSCVFIYRDRIALITAERDEPIGIVIENEEIAKTQKQVFDLLWDIAK